VNISGNLAEGGGWTGNKQTKFFGQIGEIRTDRDDGDDPFLGKIKLVDLVYPCDNMSDEIIIQTSHIQHKYEERGSFNSGASEQHKKFWETAEKKLKLWQPETFRISIPDKGMEFSAVQEKVLKVKVHDAFSFNVQVQNKTGAPITKTHFPAMLKVKCKVTCESSGKIEEVTTDGTDLERPNQRQQGKRKTEGPLIEFIFKQKFIETGEYLIEIVVDESSIPQLDSGMRTNVQAMYGACHCLPLSIFEKLVFKWATVFNNGASIKRCKTFSPRCNLSS
jgi:hypothetical protein